MKKWMLIISGVILFATLVSYEYLPDKIPIHWGISGADRFTQKPYIFAFVFISFMFTVGYRIVCYRTPKHDTSGRGMNFFFLLFNILMLVILFYTIWQSIAPDSVNAKLITLPVMSAVFMSAGNMMPKLKANHFIGIRTPWTLGNRLIWYKTHRFSGKLWFFGGLFFLLGFFIPDRLLEGYVVVLGGILIACPILYSLVCSLKLND